MIIIPLFKAFFGFFKIKIQSPKTIFLKYSMLRGKLVYNFWGKVSYNFRIFKMTIKFSFYRQKRLDYYIPGNKKTSKD